MSYPLGRSLWHATAAAAPKTDRLDGSLVVDVAIIGAGYTGLSTALHLAERAVSVAVVEGEEIGHGGSGRNAGHCTPTFHYLSLAAVRRRFGPVWGERLIALQANAAAEVFGLIRRHRIDCDAVERGFVQAAHSPSALPPLHRKAADYASLGKAAAPLDAAQTAALTGSERYHGGWHLGEAGHLHPLSYARGLARAALAAGARIFTRSKATRLRPEAGRWRVELEGGSLLADKVVLATGAYSDDLWPGLRRAYAAATVACMATSPLPLEIRRTILPDDNHLLDTRGDFMNYRFDRDGRLITSVFVEHRRGRDIPYTQRYMTERLRWLHPQLRDFTWDYHWYGDLDIQPQLFPHLFELAPGVTTAIGYSGRGVPTATVMGRVLAEHAAGVAADDLAVRPTRLKKVPPLFGLAPRIMLPLHRARDARMLRRDGISAPRF